MSYFGKHFLITSVFETLNFMKMMPNFDQKYITSCIPSMTICELIWPYSQGHHGRQGLVLAYILGFNTLL